MTMTPTLKAAVATTVEQNFQILQGFWTCNLEGMRIQIQNLYKELIFPFQ
jgi:hypothetical protein